MKEKLKQFEKEQKRNSRNITIILFCFMLIGLIVSIPWMNSNAMEDNPKDDLPDKIYTIADSKNPDNLRILEIAKKEGVAVNSIDVDISRQVEKTKTKLQDEEVYELISKELISIILSNRIQDRVNDTFIKANNGFNCKFSKKFRESFFFQRRNDRIHQAIKSIFRRVSIRKLFLFRGDWKIR